MLHLIMPNQISGPNNSAKLITNSFLNQNYEFQFLIQDKNPGVKFNFNLLFRMKRQIDEFKPDIIHISGLQNSGFYAVLAAKIACQNKILLAIRGSSDDSLTIGKFKKFIMTWVIEVLTLLLSDYIYVVAKSMLKKKRIKFLTRNKFLGVIHNSAPNILPMSKYDIRAELNIDPKKKIVVVVSRMVYDKGISFVVDAIKNDISAKFAFVFIGDGPMLEYVNEHLSSSINIDVFVLGKRNDVIEIISSADIFLFATLHENLSNALLEACAVGLAPIVTNVGGNSEVIINNYNGLLIKPYSSAEITNSLNKLADDDELLNKFKTNAKKHINSYFTQDILLNKLDEVYKSILN